VGLLSLLVSTLTAVILFFRSGGATSHNETFVVALILIPLMAIGQVRAAALRGLQHVIQGQLPEMAIQPGLLVVLVGLSWMARGNLSPTLAMALNAVAWLLAFIVGVLLLWRMT